MNEAALALHFERAQEYRDLIEDLQRLNEKQNITLTDFIDRDVLGYAFTSDQMCVQVFYIRQGKLMARDNFIFPYFEEPDEAFNSFLVQFYTKSLWPQEILVPGNTMSELSKLFPIHVPQRGKTLDLLQMAMDNAGTTLNEQVLLEGRRSEEREQTLAELGHLLSIPAPHIIQAFDNSNTGGSHPVGGMVQFVQGKPERSGYRKFKIQPMETNDDTAAMGQIIERHCEKIKRDGLSSPDLILVDGGKGQVNAAKEALHRQGMSIPVAGMVKDDRHQTAGLINQDGALLSIDRKSPAFHLLERIQDEVHRFAITFHRQQRAKSMTLSVLDDIPGIGPKRRQLLMRSFPSLDAIKKASVSDLMDKGLPQNIAQSIHNFFHSSNPV